MLTNHRLDCIGLAHIVCFKCQTLKLLGQGLLSIYNPFSPAAHKRSCCMVVLNSLQSCSGSQRQCPESHNTAWSCFTSRQGFHLEIQVQSQVKCIRKLCFICSTYPNLTLISNPWCLSGCRDAKGNERLKTPACIWQWIILSCHLSLREIIHLSRRLLH